MIDPLTRALFATQDDPTFWREQILAYLAAGGDLNAANAISKKTLLVLAGTCERWEVIPWLVALGADLNQLDPQGWTPLHMAVDEDIDGAIQTDRPITWEGTRFLLAVGADPTLRHGNGHTPGDIAARYGPANGQAYAALLAAVLPPAGGTPARQSALHRHLTPLEALVFAAEPVAHLLTRLTLTGTTVELALTPVSAPATQRVATFGAVADLTLAPTAADAPLDLPWTVLGLQATRCGLDRWQIVVTTTTATLRFLAAWPTCTDCPTLN